jgi:hypothetical protein
MGTGGRRNADGQKVHEDRGVVRRALGGSWGETDLSRSSISRASTALYEASRRWRTRDLRHQIAQATREAAAARIDVSVVDRYKEVA